jgi:hypothetical protein
MSIVLILLGLFQMSKPMDMTPHHEEKNTIIAIFYFLDANWFSEYYYRHSKMLGTTKCQICTGQKLKLFANDHRIIWKSEKMVDLIGQLFYEVDSDQCDYELY